MLVLGISGGPDRPHDDPVTFPHVDGYWHDAAAVLVADGHVVAAYEQERLSRLKHTAKFPAEAVSACLASAGVHLGDVDAVAVYFTEDYWAKIRTDRHLYDPGLRMPEPRSLLAGLLDEACGKSVPADRIHFVRHHLAHAASAWYATRFPDALVLTVDGAGEHDAGVLWRADQDGLHEQRAIPIGDSLGGMYLWVTRYLGYKQFDEYKVMGLAPYGDRRALGRRLSMVELLPNGRHRVDWAFTERLRRVMPPRRAGDPFEHGHADLAAAVQDALEEAVLHLLREARKRTGPSRLCLAGGVAHNSSLNGAIAATGGFDEVFVQPAAHDAGCALGAAYHVADSLARAAGNRHHRQPLAHAYLGTDIDHRAAATAVRRWARYLDAHRPADIVETAARALAAGAVIGWARGRSEFGPRALGNRSLLADPRPVANRDRINAVVKKRESYRPFAPVVRAEDADTYFTVPAGADCSFMSFTMPVREQWRDKLAAVTHVDGTARVQTVRVGQNPALHRLLGRFAAHAVPTGPAVPIGAVTAAGAVTPAAVPTGAVTSAGPAGPAVLLNTSLNVSAEPVVDSADDAVVFLLTTEVDALALDGWWLTRAAEPDPADLVPSLAPDAQLVYRPDGPTVRAGWTLARGGPSRRCLGVSDRMAACLYRADGATALGALAEAAGHTVDADMAAEARQLWEQRIVAFSPPAPQSPAASDAAENSSTAGGPAGDHPTVSDAAGNASAPGAPAGSGEPAGRP